MSNKVDLYDTLISDKSPPPITLRVMVPTLSSFSEGVPEQSVRSESYILLSALPRELQERVKTAVMSIISGM